MTTEDLIENMRAELLAGMLAGEISDLRLLLPTTHKGVNVIFDPLEIGSEHEWSTELLLLCGAAELSKAVEVLNELEANRNLIAHGRQVRSEEETLLAGLSDTLHNAMNAAETAISEVDMARKAIAANRAKIARLLEG